MMAVTRVGERGKTGSREGGCTLSGKCMGSEVSSEHCKEEEGG